MIFRNVAPGDEPGIIEVCFRTGHHGEDLAGRGLFNDRRLFAMLFALYYVKFEPAHCYVACDETGRIAGYILGTPDTTSQEKRFAGTMIWRIALRAFLYTWWRHPESFRMLLHFRRYGVSNPLPEEIRAGFPAHLHINLLPEYHARGTGSALLSLFESHMSACGALGIHLVTSDGNYKAVPFYRKHGYAVAAAYGPGLWPDDPEVKAVVFTKRLV